MRKQQATPNLHIGWMLDAAGVTVVFSGPDARLNSTSIDTALVKFSTDLRLNVEETDAKEAA